MWFSIVGIVLQLIAGVLLALPFVFPGTMEKVDEDWHSGRGKQRLVIVIWAIMGIALLTVFGISTYSDSTNQNVWFIKAFGVLTGAAMVFCIYVYIVDHFFNRLLRRVPNWVMKNKKFSASVRYEKLVSANLRALVWSAIGIVVLSGAIYVIYIMLINNFPSSLWPRILGFLVIFVDAFCLSTLLLAASFLFLDKVTNAINLRVKKPLWTYIIVFFVIGCLLQIVGFVVR